MKGGRILVLMRLIIICILISDHYYHVVEANNNNDDNKLLSASDVGRDVKTGEGGGRVHHREKYCDKKVIPGWCRVVSGISGAWKSVTKPVDPFQAKVTICSMWADAICNYNKLLKSKAARMPGCYLDKKLECLYNPISNDP